MAEKVLVQFTADKLLKQEATEICKSQLTYENIIRTEAKRAFYKLREEAADVQEMSLDEINAEITAIRAERKRELRMKYYAAIDADEYGDFNR